MKRFLPVLPLLGAFAGTASAAPYVLPSPQPGALTPFDWQPVYTIEGLYSFAQDHHLPNTGGVRGSFNLYNSGIGTFRHQFDINVAAVWGKDNVNLEHFRPALAAILSEQQTKLHLFMLPVTAGYNLNIELLDDILLYLGGKAGATWGHGKLSVTGRRADGMEFARSRTKSTGGFTFSVGGGIKIQCSDTIQIHAGYEFGRSYLKFDEEGNDITYGAHSIFLGIGRRF